MTINNDLIVKYPLRKIMLIMSLVIMAEAQDNIDDTLVNSPVAPSGLRDSLPDKIDGAHVSDTATAENSVDTESITIETTVDSAVPPSLISETSEKVNPTDSVVITNPIEKDLKNGSHYVNGAIYKNSSIRRGMPATVNATSRKKMEVVPNDTLPSLKRIPPLLL